MATEQKTTKYRKIIHIDMDAFYASVEQRDNPEYRGKPLIVGGSHKRGVVAAASYEARKFGIHSAMPVKRALTLCPHLTIVRHRPNVYRTVSLQIRSIFKEYTDMVEPLSLDEAFLDVTENKKGITYARDIALEIKDRIQTDLNLTASAGVSYNKFLAKIASDMQKPDGLTVIHPKRAARIIENLPIEAFWGVGEVTAKKMHKFGITTGKELKQQTEEYLIRHFGKMGRLFYQFARGNDLRKVDPNRERKSVGCERTFTENIEDKEKLTEQFDFLANELESRIKRAGFEGLTFTLKIKWHDFKIISRSTTLNEVITDSAMLYELGVELLQLIEFNGRSVRLAGFSVSNQREEKEDDNIKPSVDDNQLELPFSNDW